MVEYDLSTTPAGAVTGTSSAAAETVAPGWKAGAIASYQQHWMRDEATLRRAFARHLHQLIGREIDQAMIWVDSARRGATARIDGVQFRYDGTQVMLVRPCELCESGSFTSPALASPVDVGYALSAWQPRHPQCQPDDPVNWLEDSSI